MWQRHHQHRAASSTCVKHQGCQWHSSGNHCGLSVSGLRSGGATQAAGVAGLTHIVQLQCPLREPQCVVHGHRFHLVDLRITGVELRLPSLPRLLLLLSDAAVTAVPAGVVLVGCLRWWASPTLPGSGTSSARLSRWVCDLCVGGGGEGGWGWQAVCEGVQRASPTLLESDTSNAKGCVASTGIWAENPHRGWALWWGRGRWGGGGLELKWAHAPQTQGSQGGRLVPHGV